MPTSGVSRVVDFEQLVEGKLPEVLADYYATGAGDEQTLEDSQRAFHRFRLKPRVLQSKPYIDTRSIVQGQDVSSPLGIAPTACQKAAHPDGEKATATAAEQAGIIMIVSCWAMVKFEEIAASAPKAKLWMQIYPFGDRRNTLNMIRRAEHNGYKAIVITVDSPRVGIFKRSFRSGDEIKQQFASLKPGLVNFEAVKADIDKAKGSGDHNLFAYARAQTEFTSNMNWEEVAWIISQTKLPIILKGILSAESAREAVAAGVQGIIVSAHGGRQLDGVQAPIEALPEIVDALRGSNVEVYMDGGVRSGRDVFKALAIGAKAVFIGRPIIWGLTYDGKDGVSEILTMMKEELVNTMSLCGCNKIDDITRSFVRHQSELTCKL